MDSDSDSYFEESSDNEGVGAPLHINVEVNLEEPPESPPPGPPSPAPPAQIPVENIAFVWELPDDGTNFMNFFTRAVVLELKLCSETTGNRRNEER